MRGLGLAVCIKDGLRTLTDTSNNIFRENVGWRRERRVTCARRHCHLQPPFWGCYINKHSERRWPIARASARRQQRFTDWSMPQISAGVARRIVRLTFCRFFFTTRNRTKTFCDIRQWQPVTPVHATQERLSAVSTLSALVLLLRLLTSQSRKIIDLTNSRKGSTTVVHGVLVASSLCPSCLKSSDLNFNASRFSGSSLNLDRVDSGSSFSYTTKKHASSLLTLAGRHLMLPPSFLLCHAMLDERRAGRSLLMIMSGQTRSAQALASAAFIG